jgi:hypothetical protein
MKHILVIFLITQVSFGQDVKSPAVLVLTPIEFKLDEKLISESKQFDNKLTEKQVEECIAVKNESDNRDFVKKMNKIECEFMRNSNISKAFTSYLYGWLTFKLYGTFDDAIIYPANGPEKRGLEVYKSLSEQYNVNWIVNLKSLTFKNESGNLNGLALIELWNKNTNEITLTTEIDIDDKNYGGEMSCDDGTISCLFINGVVYISHDILRSMYSKEKYWR